ncbi:GNAT family N-acetyltransferase [Flavobacterium sp. Fl-77]|uniref:GNAT family N-acetyltransferase n=1 Tax=Flavobacterium flavipigmentatum TaxID=2893884 RepID=A0AAJ2VYM8_9FLAO|nr:MULTISPECIES: GNAT family N-acetyltransferase [unclassified Flavobacterium]MDX6183316.1 GNAT family N-acetyltransferase [Flavobacterium sp. Fl-33]MDX6186600.1 GNAT family N-acetyltransferase [Flavobacterium sp. Fl-77]UFH38631.1 GNAT family N-acetyltransferase [Flavobacterium sp. F-70]
MKFEIQPYNERFKEQMILVWENSVRSTHNFLMLSDIDYYKTIVSGIDFNSFPVFCLTNSDKVLGFIGVSDYKIEMLFLAPEHIGKGFGKTLMNFAINELAVDKVDVNEQNQNAVNFYSKFGFLTYDRTDKDDEGKDYPILKMKLENK